MALFVAFLLVPLIEIGLFIQIGGLIGLWPTLAIVVLTAIIGTYLVRSQGQMAIQRLSRSFNELRDPSEPLAEGAMILFAGALLLTPGFFTDAIGFALLAPPVRQAIYRYVAARIKVATFETHMRHPHARGDSDVIDGDFKDVTPSEPRAPSGWVNHSDKGA